MSIYLEIMQLENGDVVLREAQDETAPTEPVITVGTRSREPLVRISFSEEVKDLLGNELVGVAEAMIDAATDFLGTETIEIDAETTSTPVVH